MVPALTSTAAAFPLLGEMGLPAAARPYKRPAPRLFNSLGFYFLRLPSHHTNVTPITRPHNIFTFHNPNPYKPPQTQKKISFNLMGEFHSKEQLALNWQNCYGTVDDDVLKVYAIIGDIIFFMILLLLITFHSL